MNMLCMLNLEMHLLIYLYLLHMYFSIQGVLMEQTIYVSHCIKAILALYKGKMDSVVLIGHSMVSDTDVLWKVTSVIYIHIYIHTVYFIQ